MPSNKPLLIPGLADPADKYRRRIINLMTSDQMAQPAAAAGLVDRFEAAVLKGQEDPQIVTDKGDQEYIALVHELCNRRRALGWSQHTLARRMDISQAQISQVERGERILRTRRLMQWRAVLDQGELEQQP